MTEKPIGRRSVLLVLLLGMVAVWAIRSLLVKRRTLQEGWQSLPPRPVRPTPVEPAAQAVVPTLEPTGEPVPSAQLDAAASEPVPEPTATEPTTATELAAADAEPADGQPVAAHARAVPAAAAVASVTTPALPDAPFGPGSVRANDDGSSPDAAYVVKGKTATRIFYTPGGPYYSRTRADVWFRTDDDARAAGFTPRTPRRARD